MFVYADNAATTKPSRKSLETYLAVAERYYANASSLHSAGQLAAEELLKYRERLALLLGCKSRELTFLSGGSEADNQAIASAARAGALKGKKHIISTAIEHHAVLHTLERLKKEGFRITLLPVSENGIVSVKDLENALTEDTCLVSVMYANNEIGTLQPIEEIGTLLRARKVPFHCDAVQAVGHLAIDLTSLPVDYLALSAHKFGGVKGVGALYTRTGAPLFPFIEGGAQERGKRAGTENLPAIAAMTVALEEKISGLNESRKRTAVLRNRLIDGLKTIPHSTLNGDGLNRLDGNVNFCFEGIEGESLLLLLDDKGICASSGSACTSGSLDPSHVLLAIGRPHEVAHGSLRLTLSAQNTEKEVDYIIKSVKEVVAYLRSISPVWRDLQSGKRNYIL